MTVSDASEFQWLAQLNLRLARDSVAILSRQEFVNDLNDLTGKAKGALLREKLLDFGSSYGLVSRGTTVDHYTFPLAWVLSRVSTTVLSEIAEVLPDFEDSDRRFELLNRPIAEAVSENFANFTESEATVVRGRENLSGEGRMILQELGDRLNLSRERARQLEAQFWRRLLGPISNDDGFSRGRIERSAELRRGFVIAFLSDFMRGHGSLLTVDTTIEAKLRLFCAKCIGLSIAEVPQTSDKVIGALPSDLTALELIDWNTEYNSSEDSAVCSELARSLPLIMADLHLIATEARRAWINHASKMQKVSLALRFIGRPAHHTEVAAKYKMMFPEEQTKERNIYVILGRRRRGVVWAGIKGTYELEEWRN